MKYFKYLAVSALLLPLVAFAAQITVPAAPSAGYALVSTTTGAYIATTTNPFHAGSFFATSTTLASMFQNASSTVFSATTICLTGDICRTTWPVGGAGGTGAATSSFAATYPITLTTSAASILYALAFSTTTQNTWSQFNNFSYGLFAALASSTNATTTTLAITGVGATNCNGTNALTTNSSGVVGCTAQPQGTVTAVSVASANGFAGSSSGGATPALTISTTISGLLKGNGTAISLASAGTDYVAPATTLTINGTANQITSSAGAQDLSTNRTWTLSFPNLVVFPSNASSTLFSTTYGSTTNAFTGNLTIGTLSGLLKATAGLVSTATAGTDYVNGSGVSGDCVKWLASNALGDTGSACGAGGGSSGGTWATTTSQVPADLINHPNNNTDIVVIGASATTSAPLYIDPNSTAGYPIWSLGSSSPFAQASIQALSTNTYVATLFAIGSSTASATTTLFTISATGSTTLASTFGTCSGTQALTTNSGGTIVCGTITGTGSGLTIDPNWTYFQGTINNFIAPTSSTVGIAISASSTINKLSTTFATSTYATSTALDISGNLKLGTDALYTSLLGTGLTNTAGVLTNSGVISLGNGTGINCSGTNPGTCSIAAPVSTANGGTGNTSIGANLILYTNAANNQIVGVATSSPSFTITFASSTAHTVSGELNIPHSATPPTVTYAGDIALNTNSVASSSILSSDGTQTNTIFAVHSASIVLASSTLAYYGAYGAAGTTTTTIANPIHSSTLVSFFCTTDVGTAWVGFTFAAGTETTEVQCTTAGAGVSLASNNVGLGRQPVKVEVGREATNPNLITITADIEDKN